MKYIKFILFLVLILEFFLLDASEPKDLFEALSIDRSKIVTCDQAHDDSGALIITITTKDAKSSDSESISKLDNLRKGRHR
jgi:hypothetical protein